MDPKDVNSSDSEQDETLYEKTLSRAPTKDSIGFAENHLTSDLHPIFADARISYDSNNDRFAAAEPDEVYDEAALFDNQQAFAESLDKFQQGVEPRYKSQIDLRSTHTWDEVMKQAEEARNKYTGVGQEGIVKKINHGLRTFQTAAPAIQAWLKLLPSTSTYGSVVCGGLTIILEVGILDRIEWSCIKSWLDLGSNSSSKTAKGNTRGS